MAPSRPIMFRKLSISARSFFLLLLIMGFSQLLNVDARAESAYGIMVAAYQDVDNAMDQVNYLKRLGHEAFLRYETVEDKGKWYRVYIESYPDRKQAEEEARVLRALKLIESYEILVITDDTQKTSTPAAKTPEKEKPAAAQSPEPRGVVYILHVSSFREKEQAEAEAQELEKTGRKTFYVEEDLFGGRWFRVYIGTFDTENEARTAGELLMKQGAVSYFKPMKIDWTALSGR